MAAAASAGARLLIRPEYAAEQRLCFAPGVLAASEENPWKAGQSEATLEALRPLPGPAARLAPFKPDLLLVPSMTEVVARYNRVFSCARARVTELYSAVCAIGVIAAAANGVPRVGYRSGAAA